MITKWSTDCMLQKVLSEFIVNPKFWAASFYLLFLLYVSQTYKNKDW